MIRELNVIKKEDLGFNFCVKVSDQDSLLFVVNDIIDLTHIYEKYVCAFMDSGPVTIEVSLNKPEGTIIDNMIFKKRIMPSTFYESMRIMMGIEE